MSAIEGVPVAGLVPHAGAMCLLDRIVDWSEDAVHCSAVSHRDPGNPLRAGDRLPATAAIEYAAQAMAAHGAIVAAAAAGGLAAPRPGMLASARDVRFAVDRLDDLDADLAVHATALNRDATSLLYDFSIESGGRPVASGRIAVVLT